MSALLVNPDTVEAQLQGGLVFGLTAALYGEITIKNGRVEQSNFNDYRMLRIDQVPKIEVHLIKSGEPPGGVGETGTTAGPPALRNAIFAATGVALRRLPIDRSAVRWEEPSMNATPAVRGAKRRRTSSSALGVLVLVGVARAIPHPRTGAHGLLQGPKVESHAIITLTNPERRSGGARASFARPEGRVPDESGGLLGVPYRQRGPSVRWRIRLRAAVRHAVFH